MIILCLIGSVFIIPNASTFELRERIRPVKISSQAPCAYALEKTNLAVDSGIISKVQSEIYLDYAKQFVEGGDGAYILTLDNASQNICTEANPCFDLILDDAVTECWNKVGDTAYQSLYTNTIYTYDPATGRIE